MKAQFLVQIFITLLAFPIVNFAQFPNLRSVSDFSLFTTTGAVGNTNVSTITGKIGTNAGAITGFTIVPGQQENANAITSQAAIDLQLAYDEIYVAATTLPNLGAVIGNGDTLIPGIYLIPSAASVVGVLNLDAQGNSDAVFIIKINGAFSPGPSSQISLVGGALACNVYWAAEGGEIAIATLADMKGTFIANPGAVSMAATGLLEGRLLSTTGAIAVDEITAALPTCTTLPVTLINFKATKNNKAIELFWTVENELSFAAYDIERSVNGRNFYKIATITCTNVSGIKTYKWLDNSPLMSENFYRLKMIDIDHTFTYSSILKIHMNVEKNILIYPNPVVDRTILLLMYGQIKGEYILNIYDVNGENVMNSKIMHSDNNGTEYIMLDKNFATGIYFLQLTNPLKNKETRRILIK